MSAEYIFFSSASNTPLARPTVVPPGDIIFFISISYLTFLTFFKTSPVNLTVPTPKALPLPGFPFQPRKKEEIEKLFENIKSNWGEIDFVVHAVAFSDKSELSGEYLNTTRENFLRSMLISCFSFTEVAKEASKVMKSNGSMLTLTYESTKAIPNYNVMGVCKSALEASVKYLARDLGKKNIRVNAISAGPIKTLAASAIGDAKFLYKWNEDHSFLKRNVDIHDVGNSALYLLSNLANGVTGEIHYVDAGYNKVGMPDPKNIS